MAVVKKTFVQIAYSVNSNFIEVRCHSFVILDDTQLISMTTPVEYHRIVIEAYDDVDMVIAEEQKSLATLFRASITDDDITKIKAAAQLQFANAGPPQPVFITTGVTQ